MLIFTIFLAVLYYIYKPNFEKDITVVVAAKSFSFGDKINETNIRLKKIKENQYSNIFIKNPNELINKVTTHDILEGDFFTETDYSDSNKLYHEDDMVTIIPMTLEQRLANMITPGSIVDIKIQPDLKNAPITVLTGIKIEAMMDENGKTIENITGYPKTVFAKLILNKDQRNKLYIAKNMGPLIFELYTYYNQKKSPEKVIISNDPNM